MSFVQLFPISIISFVMIHFIQKYFLKNKLIVEINQRSSHKKIATASGGISIFILIFILSFFFYSFGLKYFDYSLLVPLSILALIGYYDDIKGLDFKLKFIFQIIVAKIIIDNGLIIDNFHGIFGIFELNRLFAQSITIIIIIAIINAINFSDGINGLLVSIFLLFIVCFELLSSSQTPYYNFSLIIFFSILPIYYFNFKNYNKVFLGDCGSYFLGGIVSIYTIYICSAEYIILEKFDINKILFVISILFYPIVDICRVFFLRIKMGKSPFIADKNHIHHLILKKTNSHSKTTIIIFCFSLISLIVLQLLF